MKIINIKYNNVKVLCILFLIINFGNYYMYKIIVCIYRYVLILDFKKKNLLRIF